MTLSLLETLFQKALGFLDAADFEAELNRVRDDVAVQGFLRQVLIGPTAALSAGLSVGYVLWLTRGGLLIASLLSSLPAWRLIDPIPVPARLGLDEEPEGEAA